MKPISLKYLFVPLVALVMSCGGNSEGVSTTSSSPVAQPQLATTIQMLCPKCEPMPTATPGQLATTIKAINPKAEQAQSTTPSPLQIMITALQSKK
jgi:hypothetical protein